MTDANLTYNLNTEMFIIDGIMQTAFYFYNIRLELKEGQSFDWNNVLEIIKSETDQKQPVYKAISGYTISLRIMREKVLDIGKIYEGYILIAEDENEYKKEKKCDFLELDIEEDEHLTHTKKGKLYFLIHVKDNIITLMLEKQHFIINIRGLLHYFVERYPDMIDKINTRKILGKDLMSSIKNIKDNKMKFVRIYFKKYTPAERIREFGYVEDAIPNYLEKGLYADLTLHFGRAVSVGNFFTEFFKKTTFEEALDVDFGEFLKIFSFEVDNDVTPSLNMLDKMISFTLPLDKSQYSDEEIYNEIERFFVEKKEKII